MNVQLGLTELKRMLDDGYPNEEFSDKWLEVGKALVAELKELHQGTCSPSERNEYYKQFHEFILFYSSVYERKPHKMRAPFEAWWFPIYEEVLAMLSSIKTEPDLDIFTI